jgi:alkanesulfonate monooxygenase SsuD/methylene tetrahydromethanopterin reductase-like flavin-dependent oxidoreductase (luciferase family)
MFRPPDDCGGPPVWVGGRSKAAFRRVGRLADGWLVSSITPTEMAEGIAAIRQKAADAGREIPEDHYGVLIPFVFAPTSDEALKIAGPSIRRRQDIAPEECSALGTPDDMRRKIQAYVDAGATKFVMRPAGPKETVARQVEMLAREVIPALQTPFAEDERRKREA